MAEWIIEIKDGKFPIGKWTPLVRCKDCKWWHKDGVCRMLSNNHYPVVYMDDVDFCSRGARMDEVEE